MKKIALIKIGARITYKDIAKMSSTLSEVLATIKLFKDIGCKIDIYSKNPKDELGIYDLEKYHKNINDKGYDALVVVNGSVPFYGGVDGGDDIYNYKMISSFKGKVIYMMYDPYLGLKDISKNIAKKEQYATHAADTEINRNDIIYITQCRKIDEIQELGQKSIHSFPLEQFPIFMKDIYRRYKRDINKMHSDLAYCGSFRGGRRQKDMIEYFFNRKKITATLIGNIKHKQFKSSYLHNVNSVPQIMPAVKQAAVCKVMAGALASIVIADPLYIKYYDIAQRAYENMIYNVANFIDLKVDPDRIFYKYDEFLRDYMYVRSGEELERKIIELKEDKALLFNILTKQTEMLRAFNYDEYISNFKKLIMEVL